MAERYRIATGNWSNAAQWDGGTTLPDVTDDCFMNNFTTTLDQDITVASVRNRAGTTAVQGGFLDVTATRTITANVYGGAASFIRYTGSAATTLDVIGDIIASITTGGTAILVSGGGALTVVGDVYGAQSGSALGVGISANSGSSGSIHVTGNVHGGIANGAYGIMTTTPSVPANVTVIGNLYGHPTGGLGQAILAAHASGTLTVTGDVEQITGGGTTINCSGAGTVIVNGDVYGSTSLGVSAVTISGTANFTINGNVTGGTAPAGNHYGINITGGCTLTINGTSTGGAAAGGTAYGLFVNSAGATVYVKRAKGNDYPNSGAVTPQSGVHCNNSSYTVTVAQLEFGSGGVVPVSGGRFFVDDSALNECAMRQSNAGSTTTMGDVPNNPPDESDVRAGVVYNFGALTGTCEVPLPGSVLFGVPVDDTVGTAAVSSSDIAAAVWDAALGDYSASGTFGQAASMTKATGDLNFTTLNAVDGKLDTATEVLETLLKYAGNRTKIDQTAKTLTVYNDDGTTVLKVFNLKNFAGVASVTEVAERSPV